MNCLYELTYSQKSIWDIEQFYCGTSYGNLATTIYLNQEINQALMQEAINIIIKFNDSLRLRFVKNNSQVFQYVSDYSPLKLDRINFTNKADLHDWEQRISKVPFNLIDSELFYFSILRYQEADALYIKVHHLISDAWTVTSLVSDIFKVYWKLLNYISPPIYVSRPTYLNFIIEESEYLNSQKFIKNQLFWKNEFSTLPDVIDFNSNKNHNIIGIRKSFQITPSKTQGVRSFCKEYGISEFIFFFGLLSVYLSKAKSSNDFIIGTPILNRSNAEQKNTLGMFISNTPFKVEIDVETDFLEFLYKLTKKWRSILKNQRYPYSLILSDFREIHKTQHNLINISLSYQNALYDIEHFDYHSTWHFNGHEINALSLHISDRDATGSLIFDYDYNIKSLSENEIVQMHNRLLILMERILNSPLSLIKKISVLSSEDFFSLLNEYNDTKLDLPSELTVQQLFEEQVNKAPDRIALIFREEVLTYQDLNYRANQLAAFLRNKGVKRDSIIAIMTKRSLDMVVSILAILKAGGAYLPIDPSYPLQRIKYMIDDSRAVLLLGDESTYIPSSSVEFINIKDPFIYLTNYSNLKNVNKPTDLAYVIYTSGSTGTPKGVMIQHSSVVNFILAIIHSINFSEENTIASFTTMSFDIFLMETILPLVRGLKIVIATEEEQINPTMMLKLIERNGVDILQLTPSRLQLLLKDEGTLSGLKNLKNIFIGGEPLSPLIVEKLKSITNAIIFNMYGPTETTVWSSFKIINSPENINIGKPICNTQFYVLDQDMELLPLGVIGELYIGGKGLARGYLNRPELTTEKFVSSPFKNGELLYRTGDLVRWNCEGFLEYIGRDDHQVKIKGYRIELGEIQNCLLKHRAVQEAVVTDYIDSQGKVNLSGYIVLKEKCSEQNLLKFLSGFLPNYMVPSKLIVLEELPLTPNGKLDKNSLPNPKDNQYSIDNLPVPARNSIDEDLIGLWAKVLEINNIGIDDNFFQLGGDSLSIVEILAESFFSDWQLSAQDFYEYPTIRQLTDKLANKIGSQALLKSSEEQYPDVIKCYSELKPYSRTVKSILLTGVTGFLGIHILKELLDCTNLNIVCLIRGDSSKFLDLFRFYFPNKSLESRVTIINGDVTLDYLGFTYEEYLNLVEHIDAVIHSAALVKHYGDYKEFYRVNVLGTKNIISFCKMANCLLYHISTLSVAGNRHNMPGVRVNFSEHSLYVGQNYLDNVYIRSKFEAERMVLDAVSNGLHGSIFRVGMLTGRSSDGFFQKNIEDNAFYELLKSIITLQAMPMGDSFRMFEFTPVDSCAKAIISIFINRIQGIFHLANPNMISQNDLIAMLNELGFDISFMDLNNYELYLKRLLENDEQRNLLKGLILDLRRNDLLDAKAINIETSESQKILEQIDFQWPHIDNTYISKIIQHMLSIKFIK